MMQQQREGYGHAVVIGGSLGGLLATRVLSDHFAKVTLIERDQLPQGAEPRKGVPQGRHAHGLLNQGWQIFARLFPGLELVLREAGATWFDMGADIRWHHFGCWKTRFHSGIAGPFMSRPLLEWLVGQRVVTLSNVQVIEACEVTQLTTNEDWTRVTGVKLQRRSEMGQEEFVGADLVVDASGRGSRLPRWLEALGYPKPAQSIVPINVGYATRIYPRPRPLPDWKALFIVPRPPAKRGGFSWSRLRTIVGW